MFQSLDDAREKLACEYSTKNTVDFYVANQGTISNGVALFKDEALLTKVEDGIYVLNSDSTIFRTVNGLVEILQEGI